MTMNLLLNSDSITILPESIARASLQAGQVVRLPIAIKKGESIDFEVLTRREEPVSPAAREFQLSLLRHAKSRVTIIRPERRAGSTFKGG